MIAISPLGQEVNVQPERITEIPGQAYEGLQVFWQRARAECEKRFTPSQCQALLGSRPTMLSPEGEGIAWYWLVGIGFILGKVLR